MDDTRLKAAARRLRDLMEPLAANVYFAPQAHAAFEAIGFGPGRTSSSGVTSPDLPAYFTSRAACMGTVAGEVVVAAFGVFDPAIVVPSVELGWRTADRETVLRARQDGATAGLAAVLGEEPAGAGRATELFRRAADAAPAEGHHLFAGLSSLGWPGSVLGDLWRAADLVREHRGDSHLAAWCAHGLDAVEVCLLGDGWLGHPLGQGTRTRGWGADAIAAGVERLRDQGLVEGEEITEAGRELRESVEWATDRQERRLVATLGDDVDELLALLEPWARAIVEARGYPYLPDRP
jgi:hypothetical protein